MKVKELIATLSKMDQEAEVRTRPENGMSRSPFAKEDEGYVSPYGYVLGTGWSGFKEAKAAGHTFPVVWI